MPCNHVTPLLFRMSVGSKLEGAAKEQRLGKDLQCVPAELFHSRNPTGPYSIVVGNLNAHFSLWDNIIPTDPCGEEIKDLLLEQVLTCVNDRSPTLTVKNGGSDSTPYLTLVGARWASKCIWKVKESIGASDHSPITTTVQHVCVLQTVLPRMARWKQS